MSKYSSLKKSEPKTSEFSIFHSTRSIFPHNPVARRIYPTIYCTYLSCFQSLRLKLWSNRMVKCSNCGEGITGKSYTRLKYKWLRKMIVPVKYCKYCYLETNDDAYSIPPGLVIAFSMVAIYLVLLIILFS